MTSSIYCFLTFFHSLVVELSFQFLADGVLLVVRPGVTTIQSAQLSKKNLEAVNAHILGVVMNGYNGKQSGRRDGYSYAYSYSYYNEDKKGNDA